MVVSKNVILSEAKHLYNALKHEFGFFAMLRMTFNRSPLNFPEKMGAAQDLRFHVAQTYGSSFHFSAQK